MTKQTYDGGPGTSRVYFDYLYDPAGNRTRLTFPDTPSGLSQRYYVQYKYDALNRPIRVCENENAAACGVSTAPLADVSYDPRSRRASAAYRNGTSAAYAYTARGDLTDHDWILPSAALDLNYDFSYNGSYGAPTPFDGQLLTESVNDPAQRWQPQADGQDLYEVNGLNQYKRIDAAVPVYDGNGNMTRDAGLRVFSYDAENMLRKAVNSAGALVADYDYYGDGTRSFKRAVWGGATTESRFFYGSTGNGALSNDQEVLETDNASGNDLGANAVLRRYLRLPGSVDEPFVMIDYTLPANDNERWAHQNRLGSVVAVTDNTGALAERHTYSPYGVAGINNAGFPFRFTGQKLDAETGLYYYKARYYDPETGRFLQTDPIGYEDQMNLYAYVGNDPVNYFDPEGQTAITIYIRYGTVDRIGEPWKDGDPNTTNVTYSVVYSYSVNGVDNIDSYRKNSSYPGQFSDPSVRRAINLQLDEYAPDGGPRLENESEFVYPPDLQNPIDPLAPPDAANDNDPKKKKKRSKPFGQCPAGSASAGGCGGNASQTQTQNNEKRQPPQLMGFFGDWIVGRECLGRIDCSE